MTVTIYERVLTTGEERVFNSASGNWLTLDPDTYGNRWLLLDDPYNDLDRVRTYRMLDADGEAEVIYQEEFSYSYGREYLDVKTLYPDNDPPKVRGGRPSARAAREAAERGKP